MFLFFRIPLKLLGIFFALCVILAFLKAYQTYKKSHTTQPLNGSVQNSDSISQFNNSPENPDVLHHTTVILIAFAFPIFISPLIYYFKESTDNHLEAMNNEFHLFLTDLLNTKCWHINFISFLYLCKESKLTKIKTSSQSNIPLFEHNLFLIN